MSQELRNRLWQRLLDAAEAPLTRRLVRALGGATARLRRRRAAGESTLDP